MKFETEADFIAYKKTLDIVSIDAITSGEYSIENEVYNDPAELATPEELEANADRLKDAIMRNWQYIRFDFIRTKAEYDFLETVPERISAAEPYFYPLIFSKRIGNLAEFYKANFIENWEIRPDSIYKGAIEYCIKLYNQELNQNKPAEYRTQSKARQKGAITIKNRNLAIPTLEQYKSSMSFYRSPKGTAHLDNLKSTEGLRLSNGKLYFSDMRELSEIELQNMRTKEGIQSIDLPTLRAYYTIILQRFEESGYTKTEDIISIYAPDLAEFLGLPKNLNKKDLARLIEKTQSFHNVIGISYNKENNRNRFSMYPVLNFEGYSEKTNIIKFSSPYINHLIREIYEKAKRKDTKGNLKKTSSGNPKLHAHNSYLVKSSIAKEKNKAAVENVFIIVQTIETTGNKNTPHIKAKTLIERNIQFAERLKESKNPRILLKRTFEKTWELLESQTTLKETYKDIKLPDPKDPKNIPTIKDIETIVFEFPHKGKDKNNEEKQ